MAATKLEKDYQKSFIKKIKNIFENCIVLKNDAGYKQGIPDWLVLYGSKWAALEIKRTAHARKQPNQDYYVNLMGNMGFSSFVYPENEQLVILELYNYFKGE